MTDVRNRIASFALCLALAVTCVLLAPSLAWASTQFTVEYSNADGVPHYPTVIDPTNRLDGVSASGTPLAANLTEWGTANTTTWYVVESLASITISERISMAGDVRLVLLDGSTLTAEQGIAVNENASLTIYAQGNGTGTLAATCNAAQGGAAIGSDAGHTPGAIALLGGKVRATTDALGGAGIGGGYECAGNSVVIARGTVSTATGNLGGAGIGAGSGSTDGGTLVITGGNVYATTNAQATNGEANGNLPVSMKEYTSDTDFLATSARFTYYDTAASGSFDGSYHAWVPDCAVAFDANGSTGTMPTQPFTANVARNLFTCTFSMNGYAFAGWSTDPTATDPTYADGASFSTTTDTTLYAVWNRIIATPSPIEGLIYNGMPQNGFSAGQGYTLENVSATNAGEHVTTATPLPGYCWSDGSTEPREITWSIAPAPVTVLGAQATGRTFVANDTSVGITGGTLEGVIEGDDVALGGTPMGTMADDSAGDNKPVTVSGYALTGSAEDCANYALVQPTNVRVTIAKAPLEYTAPTPVAGLTYDGNAHALASPGSISGGTIRYGIGDEYDTVVPERTNAGTYSLAYIITPDANHYVGSAGVISGSFSTTIARATPTIMLDGSSIRAFPGTFTITYSADATPTVGHTGADFTSSISDGTITITPRETGTATITVRIAKTTNYEAALQSFTLTSKTGTIDATINAPKLTYTGAPQSLGSVTTTAQNATIRYGVSENACVYANAPMKTEVGTYTTYYSITAPGYATKTGSWKTTISRSGGSDVPTITAQSMYRLYNPNSGEHFYTANASERDTLRKVGWRYEGIGWYAPSTSNTPVYRLYNPNAGDHHYTTDASERNYLRSVGWNYEGIGWYSDSSKTTPLYRLYNPNAIAGAHHYTTNASERDNLRSVGWNYEGIGWYGM